MRGDSRLSVVLGVLLWSVSGAWSQARPTRRTQNFSEVAHQAEKAFQENRLDDAAKFYREAVRLRPQWPEGWGYLAAAEFSRERYRAAAEAYRKTTVLTPKNGPSWMYLGFCEYELRDYRNAFAHLMRSRQLGGVDDQ